MRLGILGGTFDPPHIGHLVLAAEAQSQCQLEQVLWVLTPDPPHKRSRPITPLAIRLALLEAALSGSPGFEISRVDIDRPPPYYALDTVSLLAKTYPKAEIVYLMGGDSLRDLPTWHRPQEFISACTGIGVLHRPGHHVNLPKLEQDLPGITQKIQFVSAPLLEISSSDIRQRVAESRPFRYFLPENVYRLVQGQGLYLA
jgi:nicotinate-nucleotide adenylyltransferase